MLETHFVTFDSVPLNSVTRNCADGSPGANKSAGALTFIQFCARLLSKNCIDLHKWLLGSKYSITFQLDLVALGIIRRGGKLPKFTLKFIAPVSNQE